MEEPDTETVATHGRGNLGPDQLEAEIVKAWSQMFASEAGRRKIATALGVRPLDLQEGPSPLMLEEKRAAGLEPVSLIIIGKWAATYVVAPILVGLAKDLLKERLTRLWKQVLLPEIRQDNQGAVKD